MNGSIAQRVHIDYYYGIKYRKTIPIMVLGTYSIMVVSMDWVGGLTWASPASSGNEVWVRGVSSTVAPIVAHKPECRQRGPN